MPQDSSVSRAHRRHKNGQHEKENTDEPDDEAIDIATS